MENEKILKLLSLNPVWLSTVFLFDRLNTPVFFLPWQQYKILLYFAGYQYRDLSNMHQKQGSTDLL